MIIYSCTAGGRQSPHARTGEKLLYVFFFVKTRPEDDRMNGRIHVTDCSSPVVNKYTKNQSYGRGTIYWLILPILRGCKPPSIRCSHHCAHYALKIRYFVKNINLRISLHHTEKFIFWRSNGSSVYFTTLAGTDRSPNARELLISVMQVHIAATAAVGSNSITKLLFLKYILLECTKYLPVAFRKSARHLRSFNKMVGYAPYA